jgi:hypothetical protein
VGGRLPIASDRTRRRACTRHGQRTALRGAASRGLIRPTISRASRPTLQAAAPVPRRHSRAAPFHIATRPRARRRRCSIGSGVSVDNWWTEPRRNRAKSGT